MIPLLPGMIVLKVVYFISREEFVEKSLKALLLFMFLTSCMLPVSTQKSGSLVINTPISLSTNTPERSVQTQPKIVNEAIFTPRPTPFTIIEYKLQPGTPNAIPNFVHPEAGCHWMGVGGQVFDIEGKPLVNSLVRLTGTLEGKNINYVARTGGAINLGQAGYEFKLADKPVNTNGIFQVSILDTNEKPLMPPVSFNTEGTCDKNFILINFVQSIVIQNGFKLLLPLIYAGGS